MRVFNILFAILFALFAALQYNDPDPYLWMPIYLFGALLCYLSIRGKFYPLMYAAGLLVYGIYAAILMFDADGLISWWRNHNAENITASMRAGTSWIEETREFFGLVILMIVLAINWWWLNRRQKITQQ
ncbi:MAG: hypothetical protein JWP81_4168 [Ferruginibacter sp.]|nr:hypothetical protein [Ferruginibacter sp.]